jgi:hypothetical protein
MINTRPLRAGGRERSEAVTFSGTYTLLADISEYEPNIVDAVYLAWSHAVVIRAAYGDQHDDQAWYGGARRAQLHKLGAKFVGIYQYLVAGQDGAAQADAMHRLVGALQPGEVLIADFEEATAAEDQVGTHQMLTAWYNRMVALGYPAKYLWTYTGLYFGQAHGVLPVQWLADYNGVEPSSPHILWQFTGNFNMPGIGYGDCSIFRGTVDELAALAYQAPAPPVPSTAPAVSDGRIVSVSYNDATVAWTGHNAARFNCKINGPGPIDGQTNTVSIPQASYSGLESGHTYTVTVVPIGADLHTEGAPGQITFVTK